MNANLEAAVPALSEQLQGLLAAHGPCRLLAHLPAALLRHCAGRGRRPDPILPDHLRRDIGLDPLPPPAEWPGLAARLR